MGENLFTHKCIMCIDLNEELKRYKESIERFARKKSKEFVHNRGKEHAAILMSILIDNTDREIRMFCEGFGPELILDPVYRRSLEEYLEDEDKTIKVLVSNKDLLVPEKESFKFLLRILEKERKAKIETRAIRDEDKESLFCDYNNGKECNFSVFDHDMFRLEVSPKEYKAKASFNNTEIAEKMISSFDAVFDNSIPFDIRNDKLKETKRCTALAE